MITQNENKLPYTHYQNTKEWAIIECLLNDLITNQDIELKTAPEYVIGYIVQKLGNNRKNWKVKICQNEK